MIGRSIGLRSALATAVCVSALALSGCPKDPYDPQTWVDKLDDPHEFDMAVTKLGDLGCPEAIEPLGKAWRKHNKNSKVLRTIISLADQPDVKKGDNQDCPDASDGPYWDDAVPILIEAVEEFDLGDRREIEDAAAAAEALGRSKNTDAVQTLISAATRKMPKLSEGQRVRLAATSALGAFGENPRAIDTLIKILTTDPKEQLPQLNAAAANALAVTGSEKAIEPLLVALFEIAPIYPQVRSALSRVGKPAIAELLKVFKGKHAKINELAKEHGFATDCDKEMGPNSKCKAPGNLKFKSAALLGDLRATKAVPALIAALGDSANVSFFDPKSGAPGPPDHNAILDALRNIGGPKAIDAVYDYMKASSTDDQTRPLAIDVYSMLSRDTKALKWLGDLFQDGSQEEQMRAAAALAYARLVRKKAQLKPIQKVIDMQLDKAKEWDAKAEKAEKAAAKAKNEEEKSEKEEEKSNAEATASDYRGFAREYEQHKTRAMVGVECGDKPECYAEFLNLNGKGVVERLKIANHRKGDMKKQDMAAYRIAALERSLIELAKLGSKASGVVDDLLEHADSTDRIIRQGVNLALVQAAPKPCEKCVERLEAVIEEQKSQTTLDYLTADTKIVKNYFESMTGD